MALLKLPPPDPQSPRLFEELCLDLLSRKYDIPFTKYRSPGYGQDGIDLIGTARDHRTVGVQARNRKKITAAEIREIVEKAEKISPPLDMLWIATTCEELKPKVEDEVRAMSHRRAAEGKFEVLLITWKDMSFDLALHPNLMKTYGYILNESSPALAAAEIGPTNTCTHCLADARHGSLICPNCHADITYGATSNELSKGVGIGIVTFIVFLHWVFSKFGGNLFPWVFEDKLHLWPVAIASLAFGGVPGLAVVYRHQWGKVRFHRRRLKIAMQ